MSENSVLRRIYGLIRDKDRRLEKTEYEGTYHLDSSSNIIATIKVRRMRLTGHVAHMGEEYIQGYSGKT
jgi:hypothetical protein